MNMNFREWNTFYEASWYAYGTFIGEAVTRDTRSEDQYLKACYVCLDSLLHDHGFQLQRNFEIIPNHSYKECTDVHIRPGK